MTVTIVTGDCREVMRTLPAASVHCCVTSPPYFGLRDYDVAGQIGLEQTPAQYVAELVKVFGEVWRVLRDDGTLWVNLGDSYAANRSYQVPSTKGGPKHSAAQGLLGASRVPQGLKQKDLIGIPWRTAFALQAEGWFLRQDIVWHKPNPMPESVKDRCTRSHEYIFMFAKSSRYHYDADAIAEDAIYAGLANQDDSGFKNPRSFKGKHRDGYRSSDKQRGHSRRHAGFNARWDKMEKAQQGSGKRNKRSVWSVATRPFAEAHFATFPPDLIEPAILAGCPEGGMVLDPFGGAGTTGLVADRLGRDAILIELNPDYAAIAERRLRGDAGLFADVELEAER